MSYYLVQLCIRFYCKMNFCHHETHLEVSRSIIASHRPRHLHGNEQQNRCTLFVREHTGIVMPLSAKTRRWLWTFAAWGDGNSTQKLLIYWGPAIICILWSVFRRHISAISAGWSAVKHVLCHKYDVFVDKAPKPLNPRIEKEICPFLLHCSYWKTKRLLTNLTSPPN